MLINATEKYKSIDYIQKRNARVWMARLGCGGGGDGAHRSTRSCIKFHGADGVRRRRRRRRRASFHEVLIQSSTGRMSRKGGWEDDAGR